MGVVGPDPLQTENFTLREMFWLRVIRFAKE